MGQFKEFLKEAKKPKGFKLNPKIRFKYVGGSFKCSALGLVSLEGAPREVGGDFWCSYNKFTSLEGAPEKTDCSDNQLTSLEGAPKEVGRNFWCQYNPGPNGNGFTEEDIRKTCKVEGKTLT